MRRLLPSLTSPFLLRRLVRSHERIAEELSLIRKGLYYTNGIPGPVSDAPSGEDDDADVTYSSDYSTFEREVIDASRGRQKPEE